MNLRCHTPLFAVAALLLAAPCARTQVFVVGERAATADIFTGFTPTNLPLPTAELDERGRRDLMRNLDAELGFAHRALPLGTVLTLQANGPLTPGPDEYKKLVFSKGEAAAPGDRVIITALTFKPDRILIDINGGPYVKHRILRHIQLNNNNVVHNTGERATGSRITLVFPGHVPELSAPEVKALLEPIIDFKVKSSHEAYADTLPAPLKDAIAGHDVLVGMNRRMVLAALGPPDSKVREEGAEEWIFGHPPQTVRFVRFHGDHVNRVKIATVGKPIEIHEKDEMAGYVPPSSPGAALGDVAPEDRTAAPVAPTLRGPGEVAPPTPNRPGKVQFPVEHGHGSTTGDPKAPTSDPPAPVRPPSER